jgi:predicted metalloprotease with PDZ domain
MTLLRSFANASARRLALGVLLLVSCGASAASSRTEYDVDYRVAFLPAEGVADVSLTHTPKTGRATRLSIRFDPARYSRIRAEGGTLVQRDGRWVWTPDERRASTLRWRYKVDHQRRGGGYDARITRDWAIFRGDDLVPAISARTTAGSDSSARLYFTLPRGWTNVDTAYVHTRDRKGFVVVNPERRFDRPVGWMIAGAVGTRREFIDGFEVSIAGPVEYGVRRNDALAFINLVAPEMRQAFGGLPSKVLIVSAGDPMWRGGLSGPRSLFLHADRPLISENGSSTLVHELVHMVTRIRGADGDDWIAEGSAEFYSITLLNRAGLLSDARRDRAFEWMANHGKGVRTLIGARSWGPQTARAVGLFRELDREIRQRTRDQHSLDDVMQRLVEIREVSREDLADVVEELTGRPSDVLKSPLVR